MKIPLDFFLSLIKNFVEEAGFKDIAKAIKNNLEVEDEYVSTDELYRMISLGRKKSNFP